MARLALCLAQHALPTEQACSDALRAASEATDDWRVADSLLAAAAALAPDARCLLSPLFRIAEKAIARGDVAGAMVALCHLVEIPLFDGSIPDAWIVDATLPGSKCPGILVRSVVRRWVHQLGAEHDCMRALVRRQPCLLADQRIPVDVARALHAAEPTAEGWIALASRQRSPSDPLALSFGNRLGEAVQTLREAHDGASDDQTRETLSRWLAEVSEA